MLNLNKEASVVTDKDNIVNLSKCPNCGSYTLHMFYMQQAQTRQQSKWYSCSCGILWQHGYKPYPYDIKYLEKYVQQDKKFSEASKYIVKVVSPLLEEMIYGRKVLFVGRNQYQQDEFEHRGWITYAIDNNTSFTTSERLIADNFETYSFAEDFKVNMVWFYHTLESLVDPFMALKKVKQILAEDGILFIATPDSDFLYTRGLAGFLHWRHDFNHVLWNKRALVSHLDSLGFNVILARKNYEHRFPERDDLWCIAQVKFF